MIEDKEEYVGATIFREVRTDTRVVEDLKECLYCEVRTYSAGNERSINEASQLLAYKIPLDNTSHFMKQCPACKKIYILKDPRK